MINPFSMGTYGILLLGVDGFVPTHLKNMLVKLDHFLK